MKDKFTILCQNTFVQEMVGKPGSKNHILLIAEDDPDDRFLLKEAIEEANLPLKLLFVEDGEELIQYLSHQGKFHEADRSPRPGLILLDLNMPRKDGRQALKEIKADPELQIIPLVILTTSARDEDVRYCYDLGANSFITKPNSFEKLKEAIQTLYQTWFMMMKSPL